MTRNDLLEIEADRWLGTPWCANSKIRGAGVSCHNLVIEILINSGYLDSSFPSIISSPNVSKHDTVGIIEPFLDGRLEFRRLDLNRELLAPADVIGLRILRCVDHLGVMLSGGLFVHVLMHKNTSKDSIAIPPWSQRVLGVWRPIKI